MRFLYQVFVRFFILAYRIHALFSDKSAAGIRGRKGGLNIPPKDGPRVWVHCASLGEYEQVKPVIAGLVDREIDVVLTFFSPSGYEQVNELEGVSWKGYLPFDTRNRASKFLDEVQPDAVVFVKYEFWWNFIETITSRGLPLYFVSVILRQEHYLFKSWAQNFLSILSRAEAIYTIDESTRKRLTHHGLKNLVASADTRIESVFQRKQERKVDEILSRFLGGEKAIIFGSTYQVEHEELVQIADNLIIKHKLLIFPHEIDVKALIELKDRLGKHCMLYSELEAHHLFTDYRILIVDKIGLLKDAYRFGILAYIGGGLTGGLHNTLEPFVYQLPLIFGNKYEKFPEAKLLAKQPFVRVLQDVGELHDAIHQLVNGSFEKEIVDIYSRIFAGAEKASERIVQDIMNKL